MSDDLVKRLNDLAADKINLRSENMALKAKLSESEALLAEAVELALTKAAVNLRTYAPCLVDGPEHDVGYYYGYHTALGRILDLLAELKGQNDDH